jgi:hypothetical protein
MQKSIIYIVFLLTLTLAACGKPTEETIAEFKNTRYKVDVRSREFHHLGIRNVDVCVTDVNNQMFPQDKGQCFLRGLDFSGLAVSWHSERDIENVV